MEAPVAAAPDPPQPPPRARRASVSWADDESGRDLTHVHFVSPLPPSAYFLTPSPASGSAPPPLDVDPVTLAESFLQRLQAAGGSPPQGEPSPSRTDVDRHPSTHEPEAVVNPVIVSSAALSSSALAAPFSAAATAAVAACQAAVAASAARAASSAPQQDAAAGQPSAAASLAVDREAATLPAAPVLSEPPRATVWRQAVAVSALPSRSTTTAAAVPSSMLRAEVQPVTAARLMDSAAAGATRGTVAAAGTGSLSRHSLEPAAALLASGTGATSAAGHRRSADANTSISSSDGEITGPHIPERSTGVRGGGGLQAANSVLPDAAHRPIWDTIGALSAASGLPQLTPAGAVPAVPRADASASSSAAGAAPRAHQSGQPATRSSAASYAALFDRSRRGASAAPSAASAQSAVHGYQEGSSAALLQVSAPSSPPQPTAPSGSHQDASPVRVTGDSSGHASAFGSQLMSVTPEHALQRKPRAPRVGTAVDGLGDSPPPLLAPSSTASVAVGGAASTANASSTAARVDRTAPVVALPHAPLDHAAAHNSSVVGDLLVEPSVLGDTRTTAASSGAPGSASFISTNLLDSSRRLFTTAASAAMQARADTALSVTSLAWPGAVPVITTMPNRHARSEVVARMAAEATQQRVAAQQQHAAFKTGKPLPPPPQSRFGGTRSPRRSASPRARSTSADGHTSASVLGPGAWVNSQAWPSETAFAAALNATIRGKRVHVPGSTGGDAGLGATSASSFADGNVSLPAVTVDATGVPPPAVPMPPLAQVLTKLAAAPLTMPSAEVLAAAEVEAAHQSGLTLDAAGTHAGPAFVGEATGLNESAVTMSTIASVGTHATMRTSGAAGRSAGIASPGRFGSRRRPGDEAPSGAGGALLAESLGTKRLTAAQPPAAASFPSRPAYIVQVRPLGTGSAGGSTAGVATSSTITSSSGRPPHDSIAVVGPRGGSSSGAAISATASPVSTSTLQTLSSATGVSPVGLSVADSSRHVLQAIRGFLSVKTHAEAARAVFSPHPPDNSGAEGAPFAGDGAASPEAALSAADGAVSPRGVYAMRPVVRALTPHAETDVGIEEPPRLAPPAAMPTSRSLTYAEHHWRVGSPPKPVIRDTLQGGTSDAFQLFGDDGGADRDSVQGDREPDSPRAAGAAAAPVPVQQSRFVAPPAAASAAADFRRPSRGHSILPPTIAHHILAEVMNDGPASTRGASAAPTQQRAAAAGGVKRPIPTGGAPPASMSTTAAVGAARRPPTGGGAVRVPQRVQQAAAASPARPGPLPGRSVQRPVATGTHAPRALSRSVQPQSVQATVPQSFRPAAAAAVAARAAAAAPAPAASDAPPPVVVVEEAQVPPAAADMAPPAPLMSPATRFVRKIVSTLASAPPRG